MAGGGPAALTHPRGQPTHLYSSTTVIKSQKGNCFDFSTLLCSMLIGSGYDAYCVNGYGSQDLCHMDLTREVCPLTVKPTKVPPGTGRPRHLHRRAPSLCPCSPSPSPATHSPGLHSAVPLHLS